MDTEVVVNSPTNVQGSNKSKGERSKVTKKQRCHSPLLSLLSEMKNEKSSIGDKKSENESKSVDPLLTFQASWMDNNLFEELDDIHMGSSMSGVRPFSSNRPPLMSFDSVASDGGEAER